MKRGQGHDWSYRTRMLERKGSRGWWSGIRFGTKTRRIRAPSGSGLPIGTKLRWKFYSIQDARKVSKDEYKIRTRFKKQLVSVRR